MKQEEILSRLCMYDKRNPDYIPYDEDNEDLRPTECYCDNCFYGRTKLAEYILTLYSEDDIMKFYKHVKTHTVTESLAIIKK